MTYQKYVSRRSAASWDCELDAEIHMPRSLDIFEPESTSQETGLLDANGLKIYRVTERQPIGFKV